MVIIAKRIHLFPFRTQKLSSLALMVLGGQPPGRVRRSHVIFFICIAFYKNVNTIIYNEIIGVVIMRKLARILVLIGALNWGGIGAFGVDLLGSVFGGTYEVVSRMLYFIVGISGIYLIMNGIKEDEIDVN